MNVHGPDHLWQRCVCGDVHCTREFCAWCETYREDGFTVEDDS